MGLIKRCRLSFCSFFELYSLRAAKSQGFRHFVLCCAYAQRSRSNRRAARLCKHRLARACLSAPFGAEVQSFASINKKGLSQVWEYFPIARQLIQKSPAIIQRQQVIFLFTCNKGTSKKINLTQPLLFVQTYLFANHHKVFVVLNLVLASTAFVVTNACSEMFCFRKT